QALNEFETLLSAMLGTKFRGGSAQYTIFYLKHARAAAAATFLGNVFHGTVSSGSSGGGGFADAFAQRAFGAFGGGLLGQMMDSGNDNTANVGNVTGAKGTGGAIEIFPDARLNALFVQASPADIDVIEQLLKVIDKDDSEQDI